MRGSTLAPLPLAAEQREPWDSFLRSMFRVGVNSFGGPIAQIGVMHQEAVERRGWVTDAQFLHVVSFANMLPGPEALEVAIHLGWLRRGIAGGIAAGLLFIWPGFVSLTLLAWLYTNYGQLAGVDAFLAGIRPIALALIAFAVVRLSLRTLKGPSALLLMGLAFVAHFALAVPFPLLLAGCGILGVSLGRFRESSPFRGGQKFLTIGILVLALVCGLLWPPGTDGSQRASSGANAAGPPTLTQIAWIQTKAALLTFGGAYTVIPYLHEQMVRRTGWLTDAHVADALALGETTPGPLISFGVFLSYVAAGMPGAVVGGVCLFLPSFLLVLTLGRHVHRIESLPWAHALLWGVSAGTIGLILSLSAQLAPKSLAGSFEAGLASAALLAFWRFELNPLLGVLAGGCLGLLRLVL